MSATDMITGHQLFSSFSFEEKEKISTFSGPKEFDKGIAIYRKGKLGSHFFVVLRGAVNLMLPAADQDSQLVVGRLQQGDIFGLSPLLGLGSYFTTAQSAADSLILAVEVEPFRKVMDNNPTVGLKVMNEMARAYFTRYIAAVGRFQNILNDLVM